jgi:RNA polymerase sigma factor (sigma-70 family)
MNIRHRNQLVEANLGLVYTVAGQVWAGAFQARHRLEFDDLIQAGSLGLIRAAELYDPARGVRFSTYAARAIWSHLLEEVAASFLIAVPIAVQRDLCRVARGQKPRRDAGRREDARRALTCLMLPGLDVAQREDRPIPAAVANALDRALAGLDPQRRAIVTAYYGLHGREPHTLQQIANHRGVTRRTIHTRKRRILASLRRRLEAS